MALLHPQAAPGTGGNSTHDAKDAESHTSSDRDCSCERNCEYANLDEAIRHHSKFKGANTHTTTAADV